MGNSVGFFKGAERQFHHNHKKIHPDQRKGSSVEDDLQFLETLCHRNTNLFDDPDFVNHVKMDRYYQRRTALTPRLRRVGKIKLNRIMVLNQ